MKRRRRPSLARSFPLVRMAVAGFTILEILIATAILGIVFVGLLAALGDTFVADQAAYASARSRNLAQRVMEEVVHTAFDNLLSLDGDTITQDGFTVTVRVVASTPDLRLVEVTAAKPGTLTGTTRLLTYRARR